MNEECNGLNKKQRPNLKKELNEKVRHNKIRVWKAIRDATGLRCNKYKEKVQEIQEISPGSFFNEQEKISENKYKVFLLYLQGCCKCLRDFEIPSRNFHRGKYRI